MPPEDAVAFWEGLDRVAGRAGRRIRIHLAGGEPFGHWDNLKAILQAAAQADLPPVQKIETNAFWASDDTTTLGRLRDLYELGVRRLDVSTDIFHDEFVDTDCVRRCIRIGAEVFGHDGVRVRWQDYAQTACPPSVRGLDTTARSRSFAEALAVHRERMTGRAAHEVAPLLEPHPIESIVGCHCTRELLRGKHVHIGPDGEVFPGVCSGILLGNAKNEPPDAMWERLANHWRDEPILAPLIHEGPVALLSMARTHGYQPLPQGYADKCHLCTHVRQFLFSAGLYPEHLGPAACYSKT